ncbi:MAG: flavin reductase family protein [Planctomycetia bacterium]|nr:flavin reductase family protein [Candidatus Brocadia sp.]QOJ05344.1 MAG: flavin reductase family protein [Planctomycetia bacterium]TVL97607.1 MAG: flavoredoxin [Candidatus Brocadia sp. BL1]HQU31281.1 flavin reductase family protein [Candidatus Brocadia sapporoensis]
MKKSLGAKTIVYPAPVLIVGTYDKAGKPNAMNVAWGGLCCSNPPSVAVSIRKATYTYGNVVDRKAFTVNIPSESYVKEADYFGIVSGGKEDKFSATGLTPERSTLVDAPYIKEFPLVLECKLTHTVEIGLHTQFIGEIVDVKAEESVLGETGGVDMEKLNPFLYAPEIRMYYGIGKFLGKAHSIGKPTKIS